MKVVEHLNALPAAVLEPPSLVILKAQLKTADQPSLDDLALSRWAETDHLQMSLPNLTLL